jgi:hypothetical protein
MNAILSRLDLMVVLKTALVYKGAVESNNFWIGKTRHGAVMVKVCRLLVPVSSTTEPENPTGTLSPVASRSEAPALSIIKHEMPASTADDAGGNIANRGSVCPEPPCSFLLLTFATRRSEARCETLSPQPLHWSILVLHLLR